MRCDFIVLLLLPILIVGCAKKTITSKAPVDHVKAQLAKLAPVNLTSDLSHLPAEEVQVIKLLVKASQYMDEIFLRQVYEANPAILKELEKSADPDDQEYLELFKIMFGPWDRLDKEKPFINTIPKPDGANYYPADLTKEEIHAWLEAHPENREAFEGYFTVIRREAENLVAIPYSQYFEKQLRPAADLLKQAAEITSDQTLKTYLNSRADAFFTDDYYQSDMDWMDLAGDIEVVIGPYEVYEDNLFGYKAGYESFVCVVDHEESAKLDKITKYLNDMEAALPIPDKYKNFDRGASSPIKVVNEILAAGDTKAGIQTSAFNLPNDERVREAKGSKKVMLKNVMNAKFEKCWIPIVNEVLAEKDLKRVSFDAYFNHTLMHEISHGLGPGKIVVDGKETTVNKELKELYSTIEECKADVMGMYTAQFLIDKNVFPKSLEKTLYASNLGGMFRSIRFGIGSAHGGGVAIQLNYYLDKGAFQIDKDGLFSVNDRRMKSVVRDLSRKLLLIQAEGNYHAAKELIEKYKVIRPEVQAALDKLKDVPVDIRPVFTIMEEID
jgi:hypothetical protein